MAKVYASETCNRVASKAVQIHGGYGYTKDYPAEQYLRDAKIASIYEGTNGIQAMDLLGRKLGMGGGKVFMDLVGEIHKTLSLARVNPSLSSLAESLEKSVSHMTEVALSMGQTAMSGDVRAAFANAKPFLDVMGDVISGWMLLWRATTADIKLKDILGGGRGSKAAASAGEK